MKTYSFKYFLEDCDSTLENIGNFVLMWKQLLADRKEAFLHYGSAKVYIYILCAI